MRRVLDRLSSRVRAIALLLALLPAPMAVAGEPQGQATSDVAVMQAFTQAERPSGHTSLSDERKHQILFILGVALIVFILITALLGINMAIFGKKVFVAHTIFAGFSVTLAITHAVVAIVWFFPF
jgi:hypothetical protein